MLSLSETSLEALSEAEIEGFVAVAGEMWRVAHWR
jgi:hypothetical protein